MLIPLFIALLLTSCSSSSQVKHAEKQFFNEYANSLSYTNSYHMVKTFESGEGTINRLGATLTVKKEVETDGARTLIIAEAHRFLSLANQSKGLIPFIKPFPMTLDRVDMTIIFQSENGEFPQAPHIAQCRISNKVLTFWRREPYQNALSPDTFTEKLSPTQ